MTSSKLAGLYSASRILVAQEYSSLIVCGSFALKTSISASNDDRVPYHCFHWNSVSIPSDRMVIEVHDYA
jgi:hypothetical protein